MFSFSLILNDVKRYIVSKTSFDPEAMEYIEGEIETGYNERFLVVKNSVGYTEALHPRYPKGSGAKSGKFMPKGTPEYNNAIAHALHNQHEVIGSNYHHTEGGRNAFWKVGTLGNHMIVHNGAIGTKGVVHIKTFATPGEAQAASRAKEHEKRGRGYQFHSNQRILGGHTPTGVNPAAPAQAPAPAAAAPVAHPTATATPAGQPVGSTPQVIANLKHHSFNRGIAIEHGRVTGDGAGSNADHTAAYQAARSHGLTAEAADAISQGDVTAGRLAFKAFHKANPMEADGMSRKQVIAAVRDHAAEKGKPAHPATATPVAAPTPAAPTPAAPTPAAPRPAAQAVTPPSAPPSTPTASQSGLTARAPQQIVDAAVEAMTPAQRSMFKDNHENGGHAPTPRFEQLYQAIKAHEQKLAAKTKELHDAYVKEKTAMVQHKLEQGETDPASVLQSHAHATAKLNELNDHVKAATGNEQDANAAIAAAVHDGHRKGKAMLDENKAAREHLQNVHFEAGAIEKHMSANAVAGHPYTEDAIGAELANRRSAANQRAKDAHVPTSDIMATKNAADQMGRAAYQQFHDYNPAYATGTDLSMVAQKVRDHLTNPSSTPSPAPVVSEADQLVAANNAHAAAMTAAHAAQQAEQQASGLSPAEQHHKNVHELLVHDHVQGVLAQHAAGKNNINHRDMAKTIPNIARRVAEVGRAAHAAGKDAAEARRSVVNEGYQKAHTALNQARLGAAPAAATPAIPTASQQAPAVLPSMQREATAARHAQLLADVQRTAAAIGTVHSNDSVQDHPNLEGFRHANNVAHEAATAGGVSPVRITDAHNAGYAEGQAVQHAIVGNAPAAPTPTPVATPIATPAPPVATPLPTAAQTTSQRTAAIPAHGIEVPKIPKKTADLLGAGFDATNHSANTPPSSAPPEEHLRAFVASHVQTVLDKFHSGNDLVDPSKITMYSASARRSRLKRSEGYANRELTVSEVTAAKQVAAHELAKAKIEQHKLAHTPVGVSADGSPLTPLQHAEKELTEACYQRGINKANYARDSRKPGYSEPMEYKHLRNRIETLKAKVSSLSSHNHASSLENAHIEKGRAAREAEIVKEEKVKTLLQTAAHKAGFDKAYGTGFGNAPLPDSHHATNHAAIEANFNKAAEVVGHAKAAEMRDQFIAAGKAEGEQKLQAEKAAKVKQLTDAITAAAHNKGVMAATGETLPLSMTVGVGNNINALNALTGGNGQKIHDDAHAAGLAEGRKKLTEDLHKASFALGEHAGRKNADGSVGVEPAPEVRMAAELAHAKVKQHIGLGTAKDIADKAYAEGKAYAMNPDMTVDKVKKHMQDLGIGHHATTEFCEKWVQHMPKISPTEFMHAFFSPANSTKENLAKISKLGFDYTGFRLGATQIKLHGSTCSSINRSFDFSTKTVEHSYLQIAKEDQSKGAVKRMFNALMGKGSDGKCAYEKMGMDNVHVHGALDGGGYTWPSFGFYYDSPRQQEYHQEQVMNSYKSKIRQSVQEPTSFAKVKAYVDSHNVRLPNPDGTFAVRPFTEDDHKAYLKEHKAVMNNLESKGNLASGFLLTQMNTSMLNAVHSEYIKASMGDEKRPTLVKLLMRGTDMYGTIKLANDNPQITAIRERLQRA